MASFVDSSSKFDENTPILRFNKGNVQKARWVLWPVFVWHVVAPVPRERKINLFQRAVLGLARAGITKIHDVALRLLIAPDLAALIVQELQSMGLLNHAGSPTQRGLGILNDIEEEPADEAQVGHVLSDAFGGKIWPRFLTGALPVADVLNEEGWPVLLSGSAGDPWKDKTFSVRPPGVVATPPSTRDILRAARRHRRQREFDEMDDERDVPRLQRVSFVDDRAQPYFLAVRARCHDSGDWMVDDPFGHGEAVELRARLEERLDSQPGLRRWLAPLIGGDSGVQTLVQLQEKAVWEVEDRLTFAIRQHDMVRERLVAMQRALLEAESDKAPRDKFDDVLVKAQRAVERALYTVHQEYSDTSQSLSAKLTKSDKEFNRRLLDAMAAELGFKTPLPATLSSVQSGKVYSAERWNKGGLRSLLLLCLLCADQNKAHPLCKIGATSPDLLHRIDALATARDQAAHDGATVCADKIPEHVETTYAAIKALLLHH